MSEERGFGHLTVERSGGIGGLLLVWDLDIDSSEHRDRIGPKVAELPWRGESTPQAEAVEGAGTGAGVDVTGGEAGARDGAGAVGGGVTGGGADRYVYVIESRFGLVRFGEAEMPQEWRSLIDQVAEIASPDRRRPRTN